MVREGGQVAGEEAAKVQRAGRAGESDHDTGDESAVRQAEYF